MISLSAEDSLDSICAAFIFTSALSAIPSLPKNCSCQPFLVLVTIPVLSPSSITAKTFFGVNALPSAVFNDRSETSSGATAVTDADEIAEIGAALKVLICVVVNLPKSNVPGAGAGLFDLKSTSNATNCPSLSSRIYVFPLLKPYRACCSGESERSAAQYVYSPTPPQ